MKKLNCVLILLISILLISCGKNPVNTEEVNLTETKNTTNNIDRVDSYPFDINSITISETNKELIKGEWGLIGSCVSGSPDDYLSYQTGQVVTFTETTMFNDVDTLDYFITDSVIYFVEEDYVVNEMNIRSISNDCLYIQRLSTPSVQYFLSKNVIWVNN